MAKIVAEYISLVLTVPTIMLAMWVIYDYGPRAVGAARRIVARDKVSEVDWLVLGIVIAFSGAIVDNIYWGLAWGTRYLGTYEAVESWLFSNGVFANIPFRQSAGILAALFHLGAVSLADSKKVMFYKVIACLTATAAICLLATKII